MSSLHIDKKAINSGDCLLSSLQERHREKLSEFDCGNGDINDFVRNDIFAYQADGIATSYLLENKEGKVLSFVSLGAGALRIEGLGLHLPGLDEAALPRQLPALVIGRLGTDLSEADHGYAKTLVRFATLLALKIRSDIGCFFVMVDAYPEVVPFYINCGFLQVPSQKKDPETVKLYHRLDEAW